MAQKGLVIGVVDSVYFTAVIISLSSVTSAGPRKRVLLKCLCIRIHSPGRKTMRGCRTLLMFLQNDSGTLTTEMAGCCCFYKGKQGEKFLHANGAKQAEKRDLHT